jgi:predicted small secreted protein
LIYIRFQNGKKLKFDLYILYRMFNMRKMKELTEVIDKLHHVNEKIVERDNIIDKMDVIISIVSLMLKDESFIHSDIYLDMRIKYINTIEEKLKKINGSQLPIEPENLELSKSCLSHNKQKYFTTEEIIAPINTNIFEPPSYRRKFMKKKKLHNNGMKINDACINTNNTQHDTDEYVSFNYRGGMYYIKINENNNKYHIYDDTCRLVGHLCESHVEINSENITLRKVDQSSGRTHVFGHYWMDE